MNNFGKIALLAAVAAFAVPASAAQFVVTYSSVDPVPANNDFADDLAAEIPSLAVYASSGATLSLTGKGKVTFHYMGSESGFQDRFTAGSVSGLENNKSVWGPVLIGSATFNAGAITDWEFTSNQGLAAKVGDLGFGIFVPTRVGPYQSNVLFFGYDDQTTNADDNHDDFIVRATVQAVPEPATWALLIAGFGLVGYAARRKGLPSVNA